MKLKVCESVLYYPLSCERLISLWRYWGSKAAGQWLFLLHLYAMAVMYGASYPCIHDCMDKANGNQSTKQGTWHKSGSVLLQK